MPSPRALLSAALACFVSAMAWAADPLDTWHQRTSGTSANLHAVTYGAGRFVAVGQFGTLLHSTNGADWTRARENLNPTFSSVAYGAGLFVTVGEWGFIYTSTDAVNWTWRTSNTTNDLHCIRWLNDRFLIGGENGTLLSSLNGTDWTVLESGISSGIRALEYGNGIFVAVGKDQVDGVPVLRSTDAINWTNHAQGFLGTYDLCYHDNVFLMFGVRSFIYFTTNGVNWTGAYRSGDAPHYLTALTRDHVRYVAVGGPYSFANARIASSTDGLFWKHHPISPGVTNQLNDVVAGPFSVVAVGNNGLILQSASTFRLLPRPQLTNGEPHWTLHGNPGRHYRLQATTNVVAGSWEDVLQVEATNDIITLRDPTTPLPPFRFYRVATP